MNSLFLIVPGLALAAALAAVALFVSGQASGGIGNLPHIPLSPVLCAVLIGMLWRNTIGVPGWSMAGLNWTMRALLRVGIALVGLRLTLAGASAVAATAIPVVLACISVALLVGAVLSKVFGIEKRLAVLLAVGTAVCGCTAVIAVSPLIRARNEETAFAVACVVLFGCIAMLSYPWLAAGLFAGAPIDAGVFLGTAIHDTSQVIGAGLIYSQQAQAPEALAAASVTKLLRNLSMACLIPAAAWWASRQPGAEQSEGKRAEILPFFVIGFVLLILTRTGGDSLFNGSATWAPVWDKVISASNTASELLLTCALAAVGLSVSFNQMWRIGWRPLLTGFLIAILVGVTSLGMLLLVRS